MKPNAATITSLALVLLWLPTLTPSAQARRKAPKYRLSASVESGPVVIDDEFTLMLRVDGVYEKFINPAFADFQVVERNSRERNVLVNGVSDRYFEIAFRLRPQKIGSLVIGAARMEVGGKEVARSAPLTVEVINAPSPVSAAAARDPAQHKSQRAFIHAYAAEDAFGVGQPFMLSWDLYYRPDVTVIPLNVHTRPTLGGLRSRETQLKPGQPELVTLGGVKFFKVALSRQVVVASTPIAELVVDPLKVNVSFRDRFSMARLRSPAYQLRVKSLPTAGRPDWFRSGNVGRFDAKVTYLYLSSVKGAEPVSDLPERLAAGDFLVIDVEISGRGNLNGIAPPVLDGAQRFDVVSLTPRSQNLIKVDQTGVHGTRFYRFRLRPREVGSYATPRVRFAFYDPAASQYHTLTTKGRMIIVDQTMRPLFGGLTLENPDLNAVRAEVGWPFIRVTYTLPVNDELDVSPQLAFFYGVNTSVRLIGLQLGAEIRWNFWKDGLFSAALVPDPAFLVTIPTQSGQSGALGLRFGLPGVSFGYQATSAINLFFGFRIPLWMTFGPDPEVWLPLLADLGVELEVHRTDAAIVNLSLGISAGPAICLNNCAGVSVEAGFKAVVGGAIVW